MHGEPGRFLVRRSNLRDLRRFAPARPLPEITKGRTMSGTAGEMTGPETLRAEGEGHSIIRPAKNQQ